jgi:hypothetical protein
MFREETEEEWKARKEDKEKWFARQALLRTSHGRFHDRIATFRQKNKNVLVHHFWWFVHNCISHPAIGILPIKPTFQFHDYTSDKINSKEGKRK